jgi:hypothetical protein
LRGETAAPHDAAAWTLPYGDLPWEARKSDLAITQEIIGRQATTGDSVIVGRAGAYIHRDRDDILMVSWSPRSRSGWRRRLSRWGCPKRMHESAQAGRLLTGRPESITTYPHNCGLEPVFADRTVSAPPLEA